MKIVFLSDDFPPESFGGAGISTHELAKEIQEQGHTVSVITTCRSKSEEGETVYNGLRIFKIHSNYHVRWRAYLSLFNRLVLKKVGKILEELRPEIVHANNIHTHLSYYSLILAKKYSKGVFFTARDVMSVSYEKLNTKKFLETGNPRLMFLDNLKMGKKRWNPLRNIIIRKILSLIDMRVAISHSLKNALEVNGVKDVNVVYNGFNIGNWKLPKDDSLQEFRGRFNLNNKRVILFSGRLSAAKGGEKVIEALHKISKTVDDVVLLIVGKIDNYAKSMQHYAAELGISNQIVFTGWMERDNIQLAYYAAEVVLMPSIYLDAFGRVNIEAMAAKKPVVGTCYGGTPEVVVDGETGYIVNPLYPEQIADKVVHLFNNQALAREFGEMGYRRLLEMFNLEDKAEEYIAMYNSLLNKNHE
jgi:glycosyltransferase involved in cell wall biosynthesis